MVSRVSRGPKLDRSLTLEVISTKHFIHFVVHVKEKLKVSNNPSSSRVHFTECLRPSQPRPAGTVVSGVQAGTALKAGSCFVCSGGRIRTRTIRGFDPRRDGKLHSCAN